MLHPYLQILRAKTNEQRLRPNGLELSCGVDTFPNVLSEIQNSSCGALAKNDPFSVRGEIAPTLEPSA